MAALIRTVIVLGAALGAGCSNLQGFGGDVPPLVTIHVQATGNFASVQAASDPALRVALVWGAQWLTEPLCILPPDNATVAAVIAAGCRDPFGFVPDRVAIDAPLAADGSAELDLFDLPAADVMVGDVTARVAYASVVVYDDRDDNATLSLGRPDRLSGRDDGAPIDPGMSTLDLVYAASFVSMTAPDSRLAYREGGFDEAAAFYPRSGCGDPLPSFSIVSAGGFSAADAVAAELRGALPPEDPATCSEVSTGAPVAMAYRPPAQLHEVECSERVDDSSIRYREPPADAPDLTARTSACAAIPDFGSGQAAGMLQLVISGRTDESCVGLTHYVLRGCRNDPLCAVPAWDITATPPTWWPCPAAAVQ
jgi:predicted small secreted protein